MRNLLYIGIWDSFRSLHVPGVEGIMSSAYAWNETAGGRKCDMMTLIYVAIGLIGVYGTMGLKVRDETRAIANILSRNSSEDKS